jgi:hypothetical protein
VACAPEGLTTRTVIELPGLGVAISLLLYSTMRIIGSSPSNAGSKRHQP